MPIFCAKIFLAELLSNIKVPEFEHELEPGDLRVQVQIVRFLSFNQYDLGYYMRE